MDAIWQWFSWLNDTYGINLTIFYDDVDRGRFLTGIATTLKLSAVCIFASIVIELGGAWLQMSRFAFVRVSWTPTSSFFGIRPRSSDVLFLLRRRCGIGRFASTLGSVLGSFWLGGVVAVVLRWSV